MQKSSSPYLTLPMMTAHPGPVPSLDGLRGVSILVVLLAHFVSSKMFPGGVGVYVFFVISGFLITRLMFLEVNQTGAVSLLGFYARRILRLYPVIIVYAAVNIGLRILMGREYDLIEPASALGYFSNYLYQYYFSQDISPKMPFAVFWSLSIEEHFYILFPVTFLLLQGYPSRLMAAIATLCAACLGLRLFVAWLHPEYIDTLIFYLSSQYRLDSIGFGVLIAAACEIDQGRRILIRLATPTYAITAALTVLSCLMIRDPWFRETVRYSLLGVAIAILVSAALFGPGYRQIHWILNTPLLRWIGRLSYSLYVWHEGVASYLPDHDLPAWQTSVINFVAAFAVASLSYYVVEQPFLRFRARFRSARGRTPRTAVVRQAHT
jgi:peptidoglycan/LPS O-acetylase OafA/YrhL